MPYVANRIVHDADFASDGTGRLPRRLHGCRRRAPRYDALPKLKAWPRDGKWVTGARAKQADPAFRAGAAENILLRKNYEALGAFQREDRPRALDQLGFASQLVFTTWCLGNFGLDQSERHRPRLRRRPKRTTA